MTAFKMKIKKSKKEFIINGGYNTEGTSTERARLNHFTSQDTMTWISASQVIKIKIYNEVFLSFNPLFSKTYPEAKIL